MDTQARTSGSQIPYRRRVLIYIVVGLYCLPLTAWASEASLRVAFVYNFIKFISWPNHSSPRFQLCSLGAFGDTQAALTQLNGKEVNQKVIDVLNLEPNADLPAHISGCQMLYRPAYIAPAILPHPLPTGIILVADEPSPDELDVGIGLFRGESGHLEFEINQAACVQAQVDVSSQLLKLARKTKGG